MAFLYFPTAKLAGQIFNKMQELTLYKHLQQWVNTGRQVARALMQSAHESICAFYAEFELPLQLSRSIVLCTPALLYQPTFTSNLIQTVYKPQSTPMTVAYPIQTQPCQFNIDLE